MKKSLRKKNTSVTCRFTQEFVDALEVFSQKTDLPKTTVIEAAVEHFLSLADPEKILVLTNHMTKFIK